MVLAQRLGIIIGVPFFDYFSCRPIPAKWTHFWVALNCWLAFVSGLRIKSFHLWRRFERVGAMRPATYSVRTVALARSWIISESPELILSVCGSERILINTFLSSAEYLGNLCYSTVLNFCRCTMMVNISTLSQNWWREVSCWIVFSDKSISQSGKQAQSCILLLKRLTTSIVKE